MTATHNKLRPFTIASEDENARFAARTHPATSA
jgi:hypothetical protein